MKKIIKKSLIILSLLFLVMLTFNFGVKKIYPLKYREDVLICSKEYALDPYIVFSVIKVESNFNINAKSKKGALGLMQILPSTAEYIAEKMNIEEYDLFDSKINIKFGCFYLRYLLDKFKSTDLALCAYNAGEGNVNKWLNDKRYSDDKQSLSYIPFNETREYVKLVNKNFKIYKKIYADFVDKS